MNAVVAGAGITASLPQAIGDRSSKRYDGSLAQRGGHHEEVTAPKPTDAMKWPKAQPAHHWCSGVPAAARRATQYSQCQRRRRSAPQRHHLQPTPQVPSRDAPVHQAHNPQSLLDMLQVYPHTQVNQKSCHICFPGPACSVGCGTHPFARLRPFMHAPCRPGIPLRDPLAASAAAHSGACGTTYPSSSSS